MNIFSFRNLLILTSLAIASCAAYFSVIGISMLFVGSKISSMVMASCLEIGKLVATSFLFRYWYKSQTFLKVYLTTSVIVLMLITSLGIFGYLSASYQKSSLDNKLFEEKVTIYESQKDSLSKKVEQSKIRIISISELRNSQEKRLGEAMTNPIIARNPIQLQEIQSQTLELINKSESNIEEENKKIQSSLDGVSKINGEITELKLDSHKKSDIVTFKYVAQELDMEMDKVVKWFIAIIISVFDPLAICLLLAYNTTLEPELKKKMT